MRFLHFGALAWGGPAAQIAMIRDELVSKERWVSDDRFNRALAVYQALPGPEAHELCCYFGYLSRGRLGAFVAGLGFMLPGLVLMLLLSWAYMTFGLVASVVLAAFAGIQPAVAALIVRAVHRIGRHALKRDVLLWGTSIAVCIATLVGVGFLTTLACAGLFGAVRFGRARVLAAVPVLALVAAIVWSAIFDSASTVSAPVSGDGATVRTAPNALLLLASGLRAGLLTFGGAYTVIPFLHQDAVIRHGWLTESQFIDGIGVAGVLPAPLVIFGTFVGQIAMPWVGAIAMTIGIFTPAFAFTIIGHGAFERVVDHAPTHRILDSVTAGAVGLIAALALETTLHSVHSAWSGAIFAASLIILLAVRSKWVTPLVLVGAGTTGLIVSALLGHG